MVEDFDDFFNDDEAFPTVRPDKKADESDDTVKTPKWKRVLAYGGTGFGALVVGIVIGAVVFMNQPVQNAPQPVQNVKAQVSILDDIETVKDSQIATLERQLAAITEKDNLSSKQVDFAAISLANADIQTVLDPFFDRLLGVDPYAKEDALEVARKDLSQYMTDSASTTILYDILTGESPAKQLGEAGKKAGGVQVTIAGITKDQQKVYLVAIPFATEKKVQTVEYLVRLSEHKIEDVRYAGIVSSSSTATLHDGLSQLMGKLNDTDSSQSAG